MSITLELSLIPAVAGDTTDITLTIDGAVQSALATGPDGTVNYDFPDTATSVTGFGNEIKPNGVRSDDGPVSTISLTDFDKPPTPGAIGVKFISRS